MNDYMNKPTGHDCPPSVKPADQPKPPGEKDKCPALPETKVPDLPKFEDCPDVPKCCNCPPKSDPNCLEKLVLGIPPPAPVEDQTKFNKELSTILETAKKASRDYNKDKYDELLDKWIKLDADIADFIRRLECGTWCWHCVFDCYVCQFLDQVRDAEKHLYGDGGLPSDLHGLYDKQYWLTRNKKEKEDQLARIRGVLKAWETPAATIEKALNDNKKLLDDLKTIVGAQPGKILYDLFFKLIPLHLAVAPPAGDKTNTKIDKKYTIFCDCDEGTSDDCCGPDVGKRSLRQRLIPPQPYLINPNLYFKVICCIVEKRLMKANKQLNAANEALSKVNNEIELNAKKIAPGWQAEFEKNAKAAIPSVIDCCEYEKKHDDQQQQQQQQPQSY